MRYCLVFLVLSFAGAVFAQIGFPASHLAMGAAGTARPADPGSPLANPAGMVGVDHIRVLLGYRYMYRQPDATAQVVASVFPFDLVQAGVSVKRYKLPGAYEDLSFGFSLAGLLRPRLALGLGLHLRRLDVPVADLQRSFAEVDIGTQYRMGDGLVVGTHLSNLPLGQPGPLFSSGNPMKVQIGVWYGMGRQLAVAADIAYLVDAGWDAHTGFEYGMIPGMLDLRMGISARSLIPYMGFGFSYGSLGLDLATPFHPGLGVSPQFELRYGF